MTRTSASYRLLGTPWGTMALVARGDVLSGVLLPERSRRRLAARLIARWPEANCSARLLPELARQIADYCAGRSARFTPRLDLSALTAFQRRVLLACRRIPAGRVLTYGELARRAGRAGAARAVGQVMASNPFPLIIPCHRVVASAGRPGGFSAADGLALKRRLLEHEQKSFGRHASPVA